MFSASEDSSRLEHKAYNAMRREGDERVLAKGLAKKEETEYLLEG
jgi:hypothetical protein